MQACNIHRYSVTTYPPFGRSIIEHGEAKQFSSQP